MVVLLARAGRAFLNVFEELHFRFLFKFSMPLRRFQHLLYVFGELGVLPENGCVSRRRRLLFYVLESRDVV